MHTAKTQNMDCDEKTKRTGTTEDLLIQKHKPTVLLIKETRK